jgi:CheY-like chemotaxis protein
MLEQSGYSVVEASSGPQGLELALGGAFDLVLTDLMLPGLLGDELAARLADARPGLPVIFVSGDSDSHIRRLPEGARLIVKPFSRADLSRELGLVLAATRRIARETQMDEGAAA